MKNDFVDGKTRMDLFPMECMEAISKVLTFGANKYKPNNWKKTQNSKERYRAALLRHMTAMQKGEKIDKESGLTHASHLACNAIFLLWFDLKEQEDESNRHR